MKTISIVLIILTLVSFTCLAEFSVGLELYPERMDNLWDNGWFHNGNEWLATDVSFDLPITSNLVTNWKIKTFIFATNGISFSPSSVKFTHSVSYKLTENLTLSYEHSCHHYFKQFPQNPKSKQDKIVFEYSF